MNDKVKLAKIYYPSGELHYEGFARFDAARKELIPFGQGVKYFKNGKKHMEGMFNSDWFIEAGTEYYENGNFKFIGEYNKGSRTYYGPRYFVLGKLFDESGILWYEGSFHFKRSSIGYPLFEKQKSFKDGIEFNTDGTVKHEYKDNIIKTMV